MKLDLLDVDYRLGANFACTLDKIISETPIKHVITTQVGDMLSFPKSIFINFALKYLKKAVPPFQFPQSINFKQALQKGSLQSFNSVDVKGSDAAFLQYTGGTTGVAKGAELTHRNIIANMMQTKAWLTDILTYGEETVITALPLYHIFALTANCMTFIMLGGNNVLITNPRDMPAFIKELSKYPFSVITGVNTLFNGLLNTPGFDKLDFSSLKMVIGGGMAVQKAVAEHWKRVTGVTLVEAYGLTETSPSATANPISLKEFNGSIGLPMPSTEVKIIDEAGVEVGIGERGELCIKGPQVMRGYWNRPEATAESIVDGWLLTGDIAVIDEAGFLSLVDRKKDMILVSGFNVFPNEIEDVIASHEGVLEVAAIGLPDEKSGEVVKVFIVKKDPKLTEESIRAYCKENLTGYKCPRIIEFREDLPKSNVGKILRKDLRAEEQQKQSQSQS
jgi:long-chain acyl-CoA synthetase